MLLYSHISSLLSVAEEATVLIGAHTIGLIRNTFGASLAGPVRFHMCIS